ncbi:MAG: radical SAM protein [Clostridia bacterium]|nr:radical SAM protein [Clostridia bacterium]
MADGIIADIQRASFHDGYGIRTTVFFKGCPLRCEWCHNPECISPRPQQLFYADKCIGCGGCAEGCYAGARVVCGREMTAAEVLEQILPDRPYYRDGGGVTFSGGEPLMQREFLAECIALCKEAGISCAVETCLLYFDEDIFRSLDFVMADLKIWDSATHKKYTGVGNERIIENFKRLNALAVPIIARTPVIPGIDQGIDRIGEFLRSLDNVKKYELLPYHSMGNAKRVALGEPLTEFSVPDKEYMKELEKYAYIR